MQRKQTLIILAIVISLGVIVAGFMHNKHSSRLTIKGLSSCSRGINKDVQATMEETIYSYIKQANDYNKKDTLPKYTSEIRKDSCKTKESTVAGVKGKLKSTTIILDVAEAKQSWKISYEWYTGKAPATVVNGATAECVSKQEQIYGDFNCEKILSKATYGTDKYDSILQYMPYTGQGFDLAYDADTKTVTATITVPAKDINNAVLIQNNKNAVPLWFAHRKLDITKYTVNYTVVADNPSDDGADDSAVER